MKIQTLKFGEVEIDESLIFNFIEPILGYEEIKEYTIIDEKKDSPFKWLQAIDHPDISFVVSIPIFFDIDYEFNIPEETAKILEITNTEDLLILNIVNIPKSNPQQATINLLGPIIININNKKAAQIVLNSDKYSVRKKLFSQGTSEQKIKEKAAK